jgi:hypothetical protein
MQMKVQGVYDGQINGQPDPALLRAVRAYRMALGQPDDLNLDASFLRRYLAADQAEMRKIAASNLADIAIKEGPLPEPVAQNAAAAPPAAQVARAAPPAGPAPQQQVAQAAPPPAPPPASTPPAAPAPQQVAQAAAPGAQPVKPPSNPPAAPAPQQVAQPVTARPPAPPVVASSAAPPPAPTVATAQRVVSRPAPHVTNIPIEGSRPANNGAYRAGEPFFVGVISPHDGFLYCYLVDDEQRVSQFYPAPAQQPARVSGGTLTVVNSTSPLVARHPGRGEEVACFSSPKDLGRAPLEPANVVGLDALKTRFAIAVSGAYAMGVFDVKVQ